LTCGRNYRKEREEVSGEYRCIPKECENRTPWKNKSCSLKEDLLSFEENSKSLKSECYYLNYIYDDGEKSNDNDFDNNSNNNNMNIYNDYDDDEDYDRKGRCVKKEECPLDYPGVCNYFYYIYTYKYFFFSFFFLIYYLF
jgi:hypothetical protein